MNLRARLTLLVSLCVASAVVVVSVVAYFATERQLVSAVDETLEGRAMFVGARPFAIAVGEGGVFVPRPEEGFVSGATGGGPGIPSIDIVQLIDVDGNVLTIPNAQDVVLPVSDRDIEVAAGTGGSFHRTVSVDGEEYRVFTAAGQPGEAVLAARSLAEVNGTLADLRNILIGTSAAGVAVAAVLGLIVAQRSLRPVSQLTAAAEHVAATQDLSHSIDATGTDEVGRLATSFNTMLGALDASRQQQRRLVSDASHELRTPLTSLRTNIEILSRDGDLDEEKRAILNDAVAEIGELTKIVSELVDLAMDPRAEERERFDVRLDEVVEAAAERARRRSGMAIEVESAPTLVVGNPDLLERAIANLIDNACKWSPPEEVIQVTVGDGCVDVRDAGPGIAAEDLPHVFERFYRSADARSKPGSGLGLAIVKQVVEAHGGTVRAESAPGRGTSVGFTIPTVAPDAAAPTG